MKNIRDLLIFSLDNELSDSDKNRLEKALKTDSSLRKERAELLKMRSMFTNFSISENDNFSSEILRKIEIRDSQNERDFSTKFITLFPKVAAACVVFLLMTFSVVYFSDSNFASDELVGVEEFSMEDAYSYLEF